MSQALHTASTGINAGQSQINVIANNVANINTTAFKAANMTFETLFSRNLSYGSAATKDGGGTNPNQIGLGVKIGGITRNFTPGTFVSTERDMDCMISGSGFFVVRDADGKQFFTRDGVFSVDSAGNVVTQNGFKVVGATSTYSNSSSDKTVKIPKNLLAITKGDESIGSKTLAELNNVSITKGSVAARVKNANGDTIIVDLPVPDGNSTVNTLVTNFNNALAAKNVTGVSFNCANGRIGYTGEVEFPDIEGRTTSNFLAQTGLSNSNPSVILSETVTIQDLVNYNDPNALSLKNTSIDENGIIIATYTDGSILTQYIDGNQAVQWKYTTPEGTTITGGDVNVSESISEQSNFVIELATMINQEGLVSINNNLWEWGPDVGEIYYGVAGEMAFGTIETGGYEGSNVDIAMELSNMISAQRMIQMNSRVFSTASSVMETLAYLGQ